MQSDSREKMRSMYSGLCSQLSASSFSDSSCSGDRRNCSQAERADNVLKVESRDKPEIQQMIQVCSLLMMYKVYIQGEQPQCQGHNSSKGRSVYVGSHVLVTVHAG
jgi:hypothetical protein